MSDVAVCSKEDKGILRDRYWPRNKSGCQWVSYVIRIYFHYFAKRLAWKTRATSSSNQKLNKANPRGSLTHALPRFSWSTCICFEFLICSQDRLCLLWRALSDKCGCAFTTLVETKVKSLPKYVLPKALPSWVAACIDLSWVSTETGGSKAFKCFQCYRTRSALFISSWVA